MATPPPPLRASSLAAIGNTPLVQLSRLVPPGSADVVVKLEYFSPTGSYKDRMALAMIEGAGRRGELRPGMTVVEFTGGSTGSSLAFVCAVKGYRCRVVSSDAFAREKLQTMRAFGADLRLVPSEGGRITPDLTPRMIEETRRLAREAGIFAGISSGLNVAAALRLARDLGAGHTVATVAVDTGLKYLAGDLYRD